MNRPITDVTPDDPKAPRPLGVPDVIPLRGTLSIHGFSVFVLPDTWKPGDPTS